MLFTNSCGFTNCSEFCPVVQLAAGTVCSSAVMSTLHVSVAVAFPSGFNVADYSRVKTRMANIKLLHCVTEQLGTVTLGLCQLYILNTLEIKIVPT